MNGFLFPTMGLDFYLAWQREAMSDVELLLWLWVDGVRMADHWRLITLDALQKLPGWDQLRELSKAP